MPRGSSGRGRAAPPATPTPTPDCRPAAPPARCRWSHVTAPARAETAGPGGRCRRRGFRRRRTGAGRAARSAEGSRARRQDRARRGGSVWRRGSGRSCWCSRTPRATPVTRALCTLQRVAHSALYTLHCALCTVWARAPRVLARKTAGLHAATRQASIRGRCGMHRPMRHASEGDAAWKHCTLDTVYKGVAAGCRQRCGMTERVKSNGV